MPPADHWDSWDEEDEWTHRDRWSSGVRHVAPQRRTRDDDFGRRTAFLGPETHMFSHHRSRSQGNLPQPHVTIVNNLENDQHPKIHTEQKSPMLNPRGRTRRMPGEWSLEDELAELKHEIQKTRSRSRSSSHHHHHHDEIRAAEIERYKLEQLKLEQMKLEQMKLEQMKLEQMKLDQLKHDHLAHDQFKLEQYKLEQANLRLREADERLDQERREELIKRRMELKYYKDRQEREEEEARIKADEDRLKREWEMRMREEERKRIEKERERSLERKRIIAEETAKHEKEEAKRLQQEKEKEEERKRIILENTAKLEKAAQEAREARQRAVDEFNKEQAKKEKEAADERARVIAEYEAKKVSDAAKAKKQRDELVMQLRIEEEERKRKEQEEWDRFILKQKQKEEADKAAKEKAEKELEEQMRHRLANFGFQENQIKAMINPEEARKLQQGQSPANPLRLTQPPTYVKVHKDHLAIDTLVYYDIPYEIDRNNPDFIIILQEMDPKETEFLFEHTRRIRSRGSSRLLIEERGHHGKKPEYAFVRRRAPSRSPSRRRSSPPKRIVGIKEMFY